MVVAGGGGGVLSARDRRPDGRTELLTIYLPLRLFPLSLRLSLSVPIKLLVVLTHHSPTSSSPLLPAAAAAAAAGASPLFFSPPHLKYRFQKGQKREKQKERRDEKAGVEIVCVSVGKKGRGGR